MTKQKALTDAGIRRMTLPARGQTDRFDALLPGFGIRVSYRGAKSFFVYTRVNGKQKRFTLGRWADDAAGFTLKKAREKARHFKELAGQGIDPARVEEKRQAEEQAQKKREEANTYEAVVAEFVEKYAKKQQRTWEETERVLKSLPWGGRAIRSITKQDAYKELDGYIALGHEAKARVTLAWLRTLWRWAWKRDYVESPLMDAVDPIIEQGVRERFYNEDELRSIWVGAEKLTALDCGFVRLLALLGVRKNELAGMRRSELDDAKKPTLWTIPHERTKSTKTARRKRVYVVPLPPLAQRILRSLPKEDGEDLVFPGRHKGKPFDPGTPFMKKVRKAVEVEDWYPHAHRDTIATWLQDHGHSEYERGLVLNHAGAGSVTSDYSHGYPVELKTKLMKKWADHVRGLVAKGENVELLRG